MAVRVPAQVTLPEASTVNTLVLPSVIARLSLIVVVSPLLFPSVVPPSTVRVPPIAAAPLQLMLAADI